MVKITNLDKQILYEFDKDGRASYSRVAKNIGTTAQVVKYHYHKLIDSHSFGRLLIMIKWDIHFFGDIG